MMSPRIVQDRFFCMDSINAFNVFVQVAETRSFVAAGRALGVSASAVGKSILRIEDRFGVRLFHRSTRSVTLTAEGALFLERSRRILAEISAVEEELAQSAAAPHGRMKVGLPLVGEPFLSVIACFRETYPDVDLDLEFSDRRVEVIEDGFDAVVRSGEPLDSRLTSRIIGNFRMFLVASPAYLGRHGTPQHPGELSGHSCIRFRFPNTGKLQAWPLSPESVPADFHLPASIVCNNLEARISFAEQGAGIAWLPDFAIRERLASGELITVLEQFASSEGTFRVMWPSGKRIAPKLRVFIDFLAEHLFPDRASMGAP
jgi:DNA-binding transcriptional LysR family regulator